MVGDRRGPDHCRTTVQGKYIWKKVYLCARELVVPAELRDGAEAVEALRVGVDIVEVGGVTGRAVQPRGGPKKLVVVAAEGVVEVLDLRRMSGE